MLRRDWINAAFLTLIIIGLALALFGAYRFIDTSLRLEDNPAHQLIVSGETIDPQSRAEARGLVAADIERRQLLYDRYIGILAGGAGLVTLAVGWIGFDILRHRRQKATEETAASSATG